MVLQEISDPGGQKMLKGFKDFIMRGNIVDLAVAFVIGSAFAAVVSTFVSAIVTPIINALPGAGSSGLGFAIRGGKLHDKTFINISVLINAIIVFLMTALVVYLVLVVPMNKLAERRAAKIAAGEPEPEPKPDDIALLEQIRDLLQAEKTV
jgi:large conductance mechanosensitive channel